MSIHTENIASNELDFTALYNRYHDRLLNGLIRVVRDREKAQDLAASTFHLALKRRETFQGKSSFYTWIYAIALNEARNSWRRREPLSLDALDGNSSALIVSDGASDPAEHQDNRVRLAAALRRIPILYRRVLIEHFVRGHSIRRIAKRQRIPYGTMLSRIFKGKQLLRRAWEEVT